MREEAWKPYLFICLLGFIVYLQSVFFGFTYLDDNTLILDGFNFIGNLSNVFRAFSLQVFQALHSTGAYYRPLLTVSLMLDAQIAGKAPFFYHLTNISIHLAASCLVYLFLTKVGLKRSLSLFFSLIFVIHTALAQAVSWIPGRNDSLLTLFFLAAFILLIKFLGDKRNKYLFWHSVFFALALFTKESMVFFPIIAVFYLWFIKKERVFKVDKLALYFIWGVTIFVWFLLRLNALQSLVIYQGQEVFKSLYYNLPAILLYLGKVLFPVNLSVFPTLKDASLAYGIVTLAVIILGLLLSRKKRPRFIIFGLAWYLIFLTSSFIRPNSAYVADFLEHRAYLAFVGLMLVVGEIDFIKNLNFKRRLTFGMAASYIILLSLATLIYSRNFRNRTVFWENAVKNSPGHPMVHKNLGAMYFLDNKLDKAEVEYKKALEIYPYETMVHNNLGLIFMRTEDYQRAEEEFKKEIEMNPNYDNAYFNYGLMLYKTERYKEAEEVSLRSLEINPDNLDSYKLLILLYNQEGESSKADLYYQELLRKQQGL